MPCVDHLTTAIGPGRVVDRHHDAEDLVDIGIGGLVLVRGEPRSPGELVVDLLLVEQGLLAEQGAGHLDERALTEDGSEQRAGGGEVF